MVHAEFSEVARQEAAITREEGLDRVVRWAAGTIFFELWLAELTGSNTANVRWLRSCFLVTEMDHSLGRKSSACYHIKNTD